MTSETNTQPQPSPEYLTGISRFEAFNHFQGSLFLELAHLQAQNSVILHILKTAVKLSDEEFTALMDVAIGARFRGIISTLGKHGDTTESQGDTPTAENAGK